MTTPFRILVQFDFPSVTVRLHDGSGPYMDSDGNIWAGAGALQNLDQIEIAISGQAFTLQLGLAGVDPIVADLAWQDTEAGDVIGSVVTVSLQALDTNFQPSGSPTIKFTGTIDDIIFDDETQQDASGTDFWLSTVTVNVTNRFTLRRLVNGSVLSENDQIARAKVLNPTAASDLFCDRMVTLFNKTLNWPDW